MKFFNLNNDFNKLEVENLVIGHFNLVHNGHKKLFKNLKNKSFLIFKNNPSKKYEVYSLEQRINNLLIYNPKHIFVFDIKENNCSAEQFINDYLIKKMDIKNIYVGNDFKFGKNQIGNVDLLKQYFNVNIVENDKKISTTLIIDLLEKGMVSKANELMDINFYYEGIVIKGKQIASKIFFPTANILNDKLLNVKFGSYVSKTFYKNKEFKSISFLGIPKSFSTKKNFLETYIFDFDKNIYGEKIKVELISFIRENQKFNNKDELIKNINNDLLIAKNYKY